jgi:hypothetical protein
MYNQILQAMEPHKDKVSFFSRMKFTQKFFEEAGVYDLIHEPHVEEPISIVWALSIGFGEVFDTQLRSLLQQTEILQDHDQIIFVADKSRKEDVTRVISNLGDFVDMKIVFIDRHCKGDSPTLNWDIGLEHAKHNRVLFIRDLCLFFDPWNFIGTARKVELGNRLTNISVVLGPAMSRYADQWVYLVHPDYSPSPFLFAFVADRDKVRAINGFDPVFSRGFDHAGELDFVLRWVMSGNIYDITSEAEVLHPGIPANRDAMEDIQLQSAVNRRYFFDKYGEDFLNGLKSPLRLDIPLIEVNHALTLSPLMIKAVEDQDITPAADDYDRIMTFHKRPNSHYVVEVK